MPIPSLLFGLIVQTAGGSFPSAEMLEFIHRPRELNLVYRMPRDEESAKFKLLSLDKPGKIKARVQLKHCEDSGRRKYIFAICHCTPPPANNGEILKQIDAMQPPIDFETDPPSQGFIVDRVGHIQKNQDGSNHAPLRTAGRKYRWEKATPVKLGPFEGLDIAGSTDGFHMRYNLFAIDGKLVVFGFACEDLTVLRLEDARKFFASIELQGAVSPTGVLGPAWVRRTFEKPAVQLELPANAVEKSRTVELANGVKKLRTFMTQPRRGDNLRYAVLFAPALLPDEIAAARSQPADNKRREDADLSAEDIVLAKFASQQVAEILGGSIIDERNLSMAGGVCRQFYLRTADKGKMRVRVAALRDGVVALVASRPPIEEFQKFEYTESSSTIVVTGRNGKVTQKTRSSPSRKYTKDVPNLDPLDEINSDMFFRSLISLDKSK